MTDDQMQSMRDDIAYMKALAQEGRQTPILGGAMLFTSGVVFGLASLIHWAAFVGVLRIGNWGVLGVWMGAVVLYMVILMFLIAKVKRQVGVRSAANRATRAVWSAIGGSIFVLGVSIAVVGYKYPHSAEGLLIPSIILALWGTGWAVQAAMANVRWMRWMAVAAWVAAPAVALVAGKPEQFLAYAGALVICAVIPGFVMMRQEPSDIV